jgi:hypothetical protein
MYAKLKSGIYMKKIIIYGIITLAVTLNTQILRAQGTITYLSNLGQTSIGTNSVGNDSWLAIGFSTGNNTGGYTLDSILLAMADASRNPNNFTLMLYSSMLGHTTIIPGSSLETLNGSLNPVTAGTYTYNAPSNLTLSSDTTFFIVLTAGTAVANGAYELNFASAGPYSLYNPSGGWMAPPFDNANDNYQSSNGLNWNFANTGFPQFAINATAVPEPSSEILLGLGGVFFGLVRWKAKPIA